MGRGLVMSMMNKVRLRICGSDYTITSDEPESYVRELAAQVDQDMRALVEKDDRISTTMAAVLTALNNADKAQKATQSADNLRAQMKDYLDDNARIRQEAETARRECDRLRRELQDLRAKDAPGRTIR